MVFPTALYWCEAWTIIKTDAKRITSFEMKCYRKILRISWMDKVTNKEVLSRLDMKTTMLLQKAKTLKLKYFGHIKRHKTLERHILEARIEGRRGRGRPTRRWEQDIVLLILSHYLNGKQQSLYLKGFFNISSQYHNNCTCLLFLVFFFLLYTILYVYK